MLTILFLGDVVGEPGRNAVIARLPQLKEQHGIDFTIVNGENAAGGRGITGKITIELLRAGVSVITTGDHIWDQKEVVPFLDLEPRLLRPINYPAGAPGHGTIVLETAKAKIGVINVQARTFMQPILENPFHAVEAAVAKMHEETANIVVDVHGETTSEKIAPCASGEWTKPLQRSAKHPPRFRPKQLAIRLKPQLKTCCRSANRPFLSAARIAFSGGSPATAKASWLRCGR